MVSATHTHSAPAAMGCLGTRLDKDYAEWLPGQDRGRHRGRARRLQPARIGWAVGRRLGTHAQPPLDSPAGPDESSIRSANASGRANMHPGYRKSRGHRPVRPGRSGRSPCISVQTADGKPLALLRQLLAALLWRQSRVSADYYGAFARHIARLLNQPGSDGPEFVCAHVAGHQRRSAVDGLRAAPDDHTRTPMPRTWRSADARLTRRSSIATRRRSRSWRRG